MLDQLAIACSQIQHQEERNSISWELAAYNYLHAVKDIYLHTEPGTLCLGDANRAVWGCPEPCQQHSTCLPLFFMKSNEKDEEIIQELCSNVYEQYSFHICKMIKTTCYFSTV